MRGLGALVTFMLAALAAALPASADDGGERARIAAERRRIEERHAADVQACQARFAVNACLDEVHARRRAALDPLRRRELDLDDAERRRRAAAREQAVERKRQESLVRPPEPPPPAVVPRPVPPAPGAAPEARPARQDGEAASAAARRAEATRERRAAAIAEREKIRRREAERQARQKPSDPLPTPAPPAR